MLLKDKYNNTYLRNLENAKSIIFDSLERAGVNLYNTKHKKRIEMFLTLHGLQIPEATRWQDYIIQLYKMNILKAYETNL